MFQTILIVALVVLVLFLVREYYELSERVEAMQDQLGSKPSDEPGPTVPEQISESMRAHLQRYHRGG